MDRKKHWDKAHSQKDPGEVSWYQNVPERSLDLIDATGVGLSAPVIDVGGGVAGLVDNLLDRGYSDVTVLDVSAAALSHARERLGSRALATTWIECDVLQFEPRQRYELWHDRAVFHFLTDVADQHSYIDVLLRSLSPAGHFLLATFGPQGPERCSNLDVQRYSVEMLDTLLGHAFDLHDHVIETHLTPSGAEQQFLYSWWQLKGGAA